MADWQLIEEGLKRGYSLDEVTDIIAKEEGVDPSYARERGFDSPAILRRLGYVKPEEVKPEKGFIGNVLDQAAHGVKTAYQGLLSAPGIYAGNPDAERIAGTIQAEQSHEKPKEMREAEAAFAGVSKRQSDVESVYGEDSGYMDSIGKIMDMLVTTGKEIVTNPKGMAYEMASQSGNMVAPMVGAYAGSKTGAVTGALLGPKGAAAGGAVGAGAGGFVGSRFMEQSGEFRGKVAERLSELGLEPTAENVSAIFQDKAWLDKTLEETRDKATGTAVTDGVLAAIGGLAVNAPIRAAQKTARARLGATATAKQVSDAAADILASQPKWQKVAPHLKAGAIGWGGEPISEATGQQYGYGHVDYGDVGMEAFAAAGEGIGSVYAAAKGMRTKPTLPANVTPPPSITSASSTDDAIKSFKVEVETASPAPRGSFGIMDEFARFIESERSDLNKRRGLLAQQQQDARDMEAEFSELVKDEQIDQSYWLNDAQRQRDAERTREGDFALAEQQREEQQGRTVDQLTAASEAQGFGAEEPTAMQLAMQRAQQKALDNEFSGLLKQERASLNEMRANVKRVAGVPVEQISTPQLEENAQSDAQPNAKMEAIPALNDRHDAIQQERERLMQLRETRLEKQSNQPEQGAQHGAESHGTDGQVATPSVAGGGANVSGGGFDAAMVAADRGMRETASAGAAVSSGGQVGAVPVAEQPTNVRALTENAAKRQATQLTNQGYPTVAYPHPTQAGMWAIGSNEEAEGALNKGEQESEEEVPAVEVRAPVKRKRPASNNIAQAIINLGGISTSLKTDILGDASIKTRPGLFTTNGTGDLGEIAAMLSSEFGFSQIDLNDPTDNSGAKQLADLIASSVNGETIHNEEGMILAQQAEEEAMHREDINNKAREFGIKPSGRGRPFSKVEAEVLKLVEMRLEKEIHRAGEEMQAAREFALKYFTQEEVDAICDKAVDQLGSDASILEIYQGITKAIYEAINENKGRNRDRAANSEAEGIDRESRRSGLPEAEDRRPAGEGEGAAREGQGAEVTPEFGLTGQTEEEAIAEEQARRDVGHHNLHSIHAVLLRAVESIIPDMQRFERVLGKSQWAGYAKKLINSNDVLKGFLSQTVVGDEAKFKIALAKAADSKALESIADRLRRAMPQPEAKEIGDFGEKIGAAREGQGAEVTPEFGLVGQTEAEARAAQERLNQPEGLTKEQIDREATVPFSLDGGALAPEGAGAQGSMFTPDGRAAKDAEARKPESGTGANARANVNSKSQERGNDLPFSIAGQQAATGSTINTIAAAIRKTYGDVLDKLQAKNLITLTQTQDEAIEAAAKARAEKTGRPLAEVRNELLARVRNARGDGGIDIVDARTIDIKRSADGSIQGFYDPQSGQSFLIADGLTNDAAPGVLAHEVGIHMAADKAASKNMERLFKRAGVLVRGHAGAFFDRVRSRMKDAGETSNEEAAAYIAEEWENNRKGAPESVASYVREWIAAVKAWLAGKGVSVDLLNLGPADIAAIARANVRTMAGENGYASAHQARNIVRELGAPYETDIFGSPLPTGRVSRGRKTSANTKPASGGLSWDIQPTATLSDTEAPTGDYFVRTIVGTEVSRKLGASVIKTPEDAAKATAYLYRSAVERFDAIVTDKDGKPLGVVGGFKGALAQAAVPLGTIVAEAVRIPGAANIWFSHNHPSGLSKLSSADVNMMRALSDAFNGSGIEPRGVLAVSNGRFSFEDAHGDILNDREIASPSASTVTVPVIEREQEATNSAQELLNNPGKARAAARAYHQRSGDGIILLNSQHAVAAWIPIGDVMRGTLRNTGGLNAIYRAISEANAGAAILVHDGRLDDIHPDSRAVTVGNNIAAALQKAEVRPLDIINVKTGESAAERKKAIAAGPVYSQSSPTEAEVRGLMAQYASTEGAPSEAQIRAAVRDYRDTERAYGGQAAYEKAKAAGKTKLGYRQWVQVRTQAFKQWFGDWEAVRARDALQKMEAMNLDSTPALADQKAVEDVFRGFDPNLANGNPDAVSKVVDPNTGEPMVVYHGTGREFSVFKDKQRGGHRSYFSSDPKISDEYAGLPGSKGSLSAPNLIPVFLALREPFSFDAQGVQWASLDVDKLPDRIGGLIPERSILEARNGVRQTSLSGVATGAENTGADGVIAYNIRDGGGPYGEKTPGQVFIAFSPTQIKSATGNVGTFGESDDIRFSRAGNGTDSGVAMFSRADGNQPWYFSALEDGIRNAKLKTQPASQWVAWIRSQQQFKKEEVEWSGILDHLASLGKERVTSGDLAQWVAENGVRVEEVVLGEDRLADLQKQLDEINDRYNAIIDEHGVTVQELPAAAKKEIDDLTVRHDEIADRIADTYHTDYATKHASGNLVLPGGTDHREIVLTVPSVDPYNESDSTHYGDVGKGKQIAWTRVNTRTDADGNKVLFVEEIQSQRNQHGRKKGFDIPAARLPEKPATYVDIVVGDEIKGWGTVQSIRDGNDGKEFDVGGLWIGENKFTLDKVASRDSGHLNAGKNKALIPTAPFVSTKDGKPTDSYIPLTLKRLIAYAVDTGHDAIAWTTGEQQADRYDLSKQIDSITVWSNGEGAYHYDAKKDGRSLNSDSAPVTPTKLEEIIGKDLAEKAIADITAGRPAKYSGLDLKVGGGWTASMYGDASGLNAQGKPSMIAQAARKLGAEVSSIQLGRKIDPYIKNDGGVYVVIDDISGDIISPEYGYESQAQSRLEQIESERTQQPSFPITDQMREAVKTTGLPLFVRANDNAANIADNDASSVEVPYDEATRRIDRLQEAVRRHAGSRVARLSKSVSLDSLSRGRGSSNPGAAKSWQLTQELARFFGQSVITFENHTPRIFDFNGVSFEGDIYLNAKANRPAHVVFGHEFLHRLKAENQAAYEKLMDVIRPMIVNLDAFRKAEGIESHFSTAYAEEELAGNLVGNRFSEASFWKKVWLKAPKQFRDIVELVVKMLAEIHQTFAGRKDLAGDQFITDVEKARDAIAEAVAAYNRQTGNNFEPKFMTAWHGSPHDHDGFDSSKIGTGEGAQAYGWGHYFAGAREVAEWYRKTLSARGDESRDSDLVVSTLKRMRDEWGVPESQLKEKLVEWFSAPAWNGMRERHPDFDAFISQHLKRGRLYQVELAPDENQYLDWDKPFDEQSPRVQSAIVNDLGVSPDFAAIDGGNTGMDIYRALAEEHGGDRAASELLLLNGVRGIRYLDGSSRPSIWKYDVDVFGSSGSLLKQHRVRTKAEADDIVADAEASGRTAKVKQIQQPDDQNHNYVIFDDADVKIIAKESRRASNDLDFTQPQGSEPLRKTSFGYANDTHNLFHVSTFKGNDGDVSTFDVYDTNTGEQLGFVSLGLRDGQITTLVAIEAEQKNVGFGEQLLRSLVARNPDGIYIINMLPEAVPFWQKMGVSLDEHFEGVWEHGNGVLTEEAIQEARDGKRGLAAEDPGGRQKESRGNAESESGRQANNPVSSKGVTNETTPANAGVSVSAPTESVRRIQAVVEWFKSQFKGSSALDIRVVSTTFDIPARFRPSPFAEGVFHDEEGVIYLVAMNLRGQDGNLSERRAWQVLLHEAVGHYGLSRMLGNKFASILKAVKQATLAGRKVSETQSNPLQPGDKDYTTWEAVKLRYPDATDSEVAQEVLARMSETDTGGSVLGYAVAVVRQWVRDVARAMGVNVMVSTSELRDLVAKASGYMRRGDNLAEERVPSGLVAASQKVGAGETAFNLVDVTSAAFKKWFGDSKVVDAGGNPLRVYHGTDADLTEFKRVDSRTGHPSAQLGVFFTASAKVADRFNRVKTDLPFSDIGKLDFAEGANQLPVYLSIKNPAVLSAKEFRDLMVDLGSPPDKVYGWMRTPEGWAALRDHFINAEGRDGVKILAERNVYSGSGLEEYAADQYVAFNPTQIKSAISNTGAFDSTNPSILESRAAQGKPQGPIWSAPEMSRSDNIIYTMQDKNIDLKRVQQAIKSAVGEIRDDIDAYLQEELFHGRAAKITEEFLDKEVNPLISLMRASKVSMEELETFLWARHAKERNAQIAKINEAMPDGGSGLTNKQADDLMAGKDVKIGDKTIAGVKPARKKLLSDLAGRVDAITRGNRALLERYSLESADTLNAWDGAYKHYVPLHREDAESHLAGMGTGQGYSVKGSSSKRATGSLRPVENILANLALQRERIITRGEKNRVAQSLYGLAKEMPNADLWEVDVKPTMRTTAMIGGREQVVDAIDPAFRSKPNVVFARFNGEDRFVVFNEHNERALRMAEALKNLDADDISHLLGEVSRWTRYFASINTQYNPIFGVTNLVRDVQTGLLNLKSTPIEGKQKELMGNLTHALPAVFKALRADRKGQSASGSWAQLWEEFQEVGGQTGYRDMFRNSHERAEALQNALDPTWWQKTWWGKAATVGGVLAVPEQFLLDAKYGGKWVFNLLSDYNTMMENGIRLSAYKVALDSGMTKERAASLAKNLTVNFNRKGQAARQVGALYAFFNASVQGTARMAETLNHGAKPGELLGKAGKQIVYGGLLLGAVQAMLLMAAGFDDEEPPEFVRDRNIIIPTGNGKYVSIPMPLGFHVLPAISRISIEFTAGGFKKPGEHLVHIMDVLLDSFNPIGNAGLSMQTVAPTVLDPIAALTENKDWSGRQIARQDFSKLNPTPGHTRAKDTASSFSRGLAYALNYLSGGGEYGIGIVSPTPDQIDYLLGQLTGGVGREVGKVLTTGEAMTTGEDLPPHKIPLVGRFYGDTTGQSSEASKFYGTLEKLSEHKGTLDRMKDAHDVEAYREYAKEHPESRLYARAARVQRELASLRKLKRKMIERNADRAKVRQIEDRMRTLMTRFNQSVSEQKGNH